MRNTIFIVLISAFQVFAAGSYAQTKKISLDMKDATIKEVLFAIEEQSEFYFMFNSGLIDVAKKIDIKVRNKTVDEILVRLFGKDKVDFLIKDRYVVLTPKDGRRAKMMVFQQNTVSGKVTDSEGQSLPGVTIVLKGTTQGTVTNADGEYNLTGLPDNATLVFSFVGMRTKEVDVENQATINVTMEEDIIGIEEVVAVGYGTVKKSDLTGSVVSVTSETIKNKAYANVLQAVQGKTAGVNIQQTNSVPGDTPNIIVRGLNSISANNSPLIIIDGIPGSLDYINPVDIESVNILKGPSASAIYGARGSNGVIIVTTKEGQGDLKVSYDGYYGISQPSKYVDFANGEEWLEIATNFAKNSGLPHDPTTVLFGNEARENYALGIETDWQRLLLSKNAPIMEHNISVSSKQDNMQYYLSVNLMDHDNIGANYNLNRKSARFNIKSNVTKWLEISNNISFVNNKTSGDKGAYEQVSRLGPWQSPYDPDGNLNIWPMQSVSSWPANPLSLMNAELNGHTNEMTNILQGKIAPLDGLSYNIKYGLTITQQKDNSYYGQNTPYKYRNGYATIAESGSNYWIVENILNYEKSFGDHKLFFTGLYGAEQSIKEGLSAGAQGFPNDQMSYHNIGAGKIQSVSQSFATQWSFLSQMARINYNFMGKYLTTVTFRRDGYSAFGVDRKYGNFPSFAVAWRLSEENFLNNNPVLSYLKLRFSWGKNGNQAINPYAAQSKIQQTPEPYSFGDPGSGVYGMNPTTLGNSTLGWETTRSSNIAIDFGIFENRINGNLEYYHNLTDDILLKRNIPKTTGFSSIMDNVGKTQNDGIELVINSDNISNPEGFNWSSNFNVSYNKNQIVDLYGDKKDDIGNGWFIGEPLGSIYTYVYDGIWQLDDDIANSHMPDAGPGTVKVKDLNGNGKVDGDDRQIIAQSNPDFLWGLTNSFTYKNFELEIFVHGVHGQTALVRGLWWFIKHPRQNIVKYDFWTPDNPDGKYPGSRLSNSYTFMTMYENASFVRLKDITLGYRLPSNIINKLGISNAKIYLNSTNVFTISEWSMYDPETKHPWQPLNRTFILGINLDF